MQWKNILAFFIAMKNCPPPYYKVPQNEGMTSFTCIKFQNNATTFGQHLSMCQDDGGYLAEPTLYVQDFLFDVMYFGNVCYYVGGTDIEVEGIWRWVKSGNLFNSSSVRWSQTSNEPDGGTVQNCAGFCNPEYDMFDLWCDYETFHALCQIDLEPEDNNCQCCTT